MCMHGLQHLQILSFKTITLSFSQFCFAIYLLQKKKTVEVLSFNQNNYWRLCGGINTNSVKVLKHWQAVINEWIVFAVLLLHKLQTYWACPHSLGSGSWWTKFWQLIFCATAGCTASVHQCCTSPSQLRGEASSLTTGTVSCPTLIRCVFYSSCNDWFIIKATDNLDSVTPSLNLMVRCTNLFLKQRVPSPVVGYCRLYKLRSSLMGTREPCQKLSLSKLGVGQSFACSTCWQDFYRST